MAARPLAVVSGGGGVACARARDPAEGAEVEVAHDGLKEFAGKVGEERFHAVHLSSVIEFALHSAMCCECSRRRFCVS